jgi:hypothetical protein
LIRRATALSDPFLRLRPGLCADIYLEGVKANRRVEAAVRAASE